jgi:hypothetical protein
MDLLVGCGLGYILSVPILLYLETSTGATRWPAILIMVMSMFANSPHFGATLVRVYDAREDRRKYAVFSVYVTIALAVLLVASAHSVWLASLVITAYLTWSPWHFSGQNYGLTLMFLRKRRIEVDPATKRLVYASFVLSAVLAIIAVHAGHDDLIFAPHTLRVAGAPTIHSFPLPPALAQVAVPGLLLAYLGCLAGAGWRLRSRAPLRAFAPAIVLVATQALWFTVPALLLDWGRARGATLVFAAVWISTAHSIQYLWVTAYYAKASGSGASFGGFFLKSLLAGSAVVAVPGVLLAPQLLGEMPWDVGLAATIFAMVNLHHFILDGAIWKLRDGRVARVLLRGREEPTLPDPIDAHVRRPWLRRAVWSVAALAFAITLIGNYAQNEIDQTDRTDRVGSLVRILRWTGREKVEIQFEIARRLAARGDHEGAIEHYRRSIELFPTARTWAALAEEYRAVGRSDLAVSAFDAALALNPDYPQARLRRAEALIEGEPSRAKSAAAP